MSHACAQWRGDIGAYIVGALDSSARDRVIRHVAACAACRADYDELVPVRDWLGLLALTADGPQSRHDERPGRPLHNSLQARPVPAARPGETLVRPSRRGSGARFRTQPADKSRAIQPRTWRRLSAAGAVLAGAAAAAAAVAALLGSGAPARTFRAADSATGVSGHAQLHGTPTGTQIDLTASGLPGHERCILIAVTQHGTDVAGSWAATYDGSARIAGTTAFPAKRLIALRIESDTGVVLLSIPV
jgi:Putative zinc-finger